MSIKMQSRLGNVAFEIEATLRDGREQDAAKKALEALVFHGAGSKAFGPKAHQRDEVYSDALASDVKAAIEDKAGGIFEIKSIATKAYVKAAPDAEKLLKGLESIGFDVSGLRAQAAKTEAKEESVG